MLASRINHHPIVVPGDDRCSMGYVTAHHSPPFALTTTAGMTDISDWDHRAIDHPRTDSITSHSDDDEISHHHHHHCERMGDQSSSTRFEEGESVGHASFPPNHGSVPAKDLCSSTLLPPYDHDDETTVRSIDSLSHTAASVTETPPRSRHGSTASTPTSLLPEEEPPPSTTNPRRSSELTDDGSQPPSSHLPRSFPSSVHRSYESGVAGVPTAAAGLLTTEEDASRHSSRWEQPGDSRTNLPPPHSLRRPLQNRPWDMPSSSPASSAGGRPTGPPLLPQTTYPYEPLPHPSAWTGRSAVSRHSSSQPFIRSPTTTPDARSDYPSIMWSTTTSRAASHINETRWAHAPTSSSYPGNYLLPPLHHQQHQLQQLPQQQPPTSMAQFLPRSPMLNGHHLSHHPLAPPPSNSTMSTFHALPTGSHRLTASVVGAPRHVRQGSWGSVGSHPASPNAVGSSSSSSARGHEQPQPQHSPSIASASAGGARSPSEVLKTLLRKKACLYEPDTSRAIALATWLVAKELSLEYGFFSRQQLQVGVHTCVADKIDSGTITRTKVNRCMQIILNSCFHYIIPRPDGTDESGEHFQAVFESQARDDAFLLQRLPSPWNNIVVDRQRILQAVQAEIEATTTAAAGSCVSHSSAPAVSKMTSPMTTPQCSPRIGPVADKGSPDALDSVRLDSHDGDDPDSKRAVMLCLNENVRSAEDVFRCHNEFIRDTAHASQLQLSSYEWRIFFGKHAADTPHMWGGIGIPVPSTEDHGSETHADALGIMVKDELAKFRTCWCNKRYEHDHELCGFAHSEVNYGWLRRNPLTFPYRDEMCSAVTVVKEATLGSIRNASTTTTTYIINECPEGVCCGKSHSMEELVYHPRRYKSQVCSHCSRGCPGGEICPLFHPVDSYRFSKKQEYRGHGARQHQHHHHPSQQQQHAHSHSHTHHSHSRQHHDAAGNYRRISLAGSPVLYVSPAPTSNFEQQLLLPGLQQLFRQNCAIIRAHLNATQGGTGANPKQFSYFGDERPTSRSNSTVM